MIDNNWSHPLQQDNKNLKSPHILWLRIFPNSLSIWTTHECLLMSHIGSLFTKIEMSYFLIVRWYIWAFFLFKIFIDVLLWTCSQCGSQICSVLHLPVKTPVGTDHGWWFWNSGCHGKHMYKLIAITCISWRKHWLPQESWGYLFIHLIKICASFPMAFHFCWMSHIGRGYWLLPYITLGSTHLMN